MNVMRLAIPLVLTWVLAPALAAAGFCDPPTLVLTVDDVRALADISPGDGSCETATGSCTLLAALEEANAHPGCDAIAVPAGTYLVRPGLLHVRDDLELIGAGSDETIIDGQYGGIDPNCLPVDLLFDPTATPSACVPGADFDVLSIIGHSPLVRLHDGVRASIRGVTLQRGVSGWGGGIWNDGSLELTSSVIQDCFAFNPGGGIYTRGPLTLRNSTIRGNRAGNVGGGIAIGSDEAKPHVTIQRSTFIDNAAGNVGGALYTDSRLDVEDSTFDGNAATGRGGAITTGEGSAHLRRITVTRSFHTCFTNPGCSTVLAGGAVSGPRVTLEDSILHDNAEVDCEEAVTLIGTNLIGDASACALQGNVAGALIGVDPLLGPLQDNGGFTATRAPLPGSPAIDAGSASCVGSDQRGVPRPQGAACDIGALETIACDYDGNLEPGEQCDDGNAVDGDGCSSLCQAELLSGQTLNLGTRVGAPSRAKLTTASMDARIAIGWGNWSADDPALHGGAVRIVTRAGDGFDHTYNLSAANWRYIGRPGQNRGYRYKDKLGPIRLVKIRPGRQIKVVGRGAQLGHSLGLNPDPVVVFVSIGSRVFCSEYGGQVTFTRDGSFRAKDASAPVSFQAF